MRLGDRFWAAPLPGGAEGVRSTPEQRQRWPWECRELILWPLPFLLHTHSGGLGKEGDLLNLLGPCELPSVMAGLAEIRKLGWSIMGHGGEPEASLLGALWSWGWPETPHTDLNPKKIPFYKSGIYAWPRSLEAQGGPCYWARDRRLLSCPHVPAGESLSAPKPEECGGQIPKGEAVSVGEDAGKVSLQPAGGM